MNQIVKVCREVELRLHTVQQYIRLLDMYYYLDCNMELWVEDMELNMSVQMSKHYLNFLQMMDFYMQLVSLRYTNHPVCNTFQCHRRMDQEYRKHQILGIDRHLCHIEIN